MIGSILAVAALSGTYVCWLSAPGDEQDFCLVLFSQPATGWTMSAWYNLGRLHGRAR